MLYNGKFGSNIYGALKLLVIIVFCSFFAVLTAVSIAVLIYDVALNLISILCNESDSPDRMLATALTSIDNL